MKASTIAHDAGRQVALTLSDSFCVDRYRGEFLELMRNGTVDLVFANEAELHSLYQTSDFESALKQLRADVNLGVVTRSEKGCVVASSDGVTAVPAFPIEKMVDTTGAGDLFAAGFLFGLVRGAGHRNCRPARRARRGRSDPAHRRAAAGVAEGTGAAERVAGVESSSPAQRSGYDLARGMPGRAAGAAGWVDGYLGGMVSINGIYHIEGGGIMSATAKLFMHGRSQAVRLPKEFRIEGEEVRVSRVGDKVILEPLEKPPFDAKAFWASSTRLAARIFLPDGIPDEPPAEPDPRDLLRRMICLDTNIVISIVNGRSPSLRHRLGEQVRAGTSIALPVIALFEMRYGFAKSDRRELTNGCSNNFLVSVSSFSRLSRRMRCMPVISAPNLKRQARRSATTTILSPPRRAAAVLLWSRPTFASSRACQGC